MHANHLMVWSPVVIMFKELQLSHRQKVEVGVARMGHNTGVTPNFLWTAMALIWL